MAERTPTYPAGYDPAPRLTVKELLEADLRRKKMSQKDLAEQLGLSQGAIGNWVSDNAVPWGRYAALHTILGESSVLVKEMRRRRIYEPDAKPYFEVPDDPPPKAAEPTVRFSRRRIFPEQGEPEPQEPPDPMHHESVEAAFERAIPKELERNLGSLIDRRFAADYASDKVVVDIYAPDRFMPTMMANRIFRLAVAAKREPPDSARQYVLFVIPGDVDDPATKIRLQRYVADADLLGVRVLLVPNGEMAAAITVAIETGKVNFFGDLPDDEGLTLG